jgi:rubredoxin
MHVGCSRNPWRIVAQFNPAGAVGCLARRLRELHFEYDASSLARLICTDRSGDDLKEMRKWQCIVCGWIYDEAEGYEEEDIAPGTAWENVPEDFVCPECGVSKEDFEMIEVG